MGQRGHASDRVVSRSGKATKKDGRWSQNDEVDWREPERIERLRVLMAQGLTAGQIRDAFGDCTRASVIGAAHRLVRSGRLKEGLKHKKHVKGKDEGPKAIRSKQNHPTTIRVKRRDQHGHLETVTHKVVAEEPNLVKYNKSRLPHAKDLSSVTGCKWLVTDNPPHLYCDEKVDGKGSYCEIHAAWARGTQYDPNKRKGGGLSKFWMAPKR